MSAGEALVAAALDALRQVAGLTGVHEAMPVQAAAPYATVEAGLEMDWGHKSGAGRELRLTVTLRDAGERAMRLRALAAQAQAALDGLVIGPGWQLVTLSLVRSMTLPESPGRWLLTLDYRARMLSA
jgi:hypothetical protein